MRFAARLAILWSSLAHLVSHGVAESQLVGKGYGSTSPVEDPKDIESAKIDAPRATCAAAPEARSSEDGRAETP